MNPIHIMDWRQDFMTGLADFLIRQASGQASGQADNRASKNLSKSVVIIPHNRPKRYLRVCGYLLSLS